MSTRSWLLDTFIMLGLGAAAVPLGDNSHLVRRMRSRQAAPAASGARLAHRGRGDELAGTPRARC